MSRSDGIIKGRFALFCDNAFTSSDGKLNIIGEFDQLISTSGKPLLNRAFLVGSLKGVPNSKADIEVRFVNGKGIDILPKQILSVTFGIGRIANILVEIAGLVFEQSGLYRGIFSEGGKIVAEASITVTEGTSSATKGRSSVN